VRQIVRASMSDPVTSTMTADFPERERDRREGREGAFMSISTFGPLPVLETGITWPSTKSEAHYCGDALAQGAVRGLRASAAASRSISRRPEILRVDCYGEDPYKSATAPEARMSK